jgi:biopolymer transport protein ExbB/TolQ
MDSGIRSILEILAAAIPIVTGLYLGWIKYCDTMVKVAEAKGAGSEAMNKLSQLVSEGFAKMESANGQRDVIIKKLEMADHALNSAEETRRREYERAAQELREFKNQIEQRMIASDQRLINILQEIANRNPYRKVTE